MKEFLEYVARSLVDKPDAVSVEAEDEGDETILTLVVDQEDMGRVIGRDGRIANAIRSLLRVMATRMDATSSSRSSPTPTEPRRVVARILRPKGLRGGVRVELLTDWPDRIAPGAEVWVEGAPDPVEVTAVETGGRIPVLHLSGVTSRDEAERLAGRYLEAVAARLDEGTYFWEDLVGLRVETADGTPVGELVEVFRAGANEVYRVIGADGERLVPALRSAVERIDLAAGLMVIAPDDAEEVR